MRRQRNHRACTRYLVSRSGMSVCCSAAELIHNDDPISDAPLSSFHCECVDPSLNYTAHSTLLILHGSVSLLLAAQYLPSDPEPLSSHCLSLSHQSASKEGPLIARSTDNIDKTLMSCPPLRATIHPFDLIAIDTTNENKTFTIRVDDCNNSLVEAVHLSECSRRQVHRFRQ